MKVRKKARINHRCDMHLALNKIMNLSLRGGVYSDLFSCRFSAGWRTRSAGSKKRAGSQQVLLGLLVSELGNFHFLATTIIFTHISVTSRTV